MPGIEDLTSGHVDWRLEYFAAQERISDHLGQVGLEAIRAEDPDGPPVDIVSAMVLATGCSIDAAQIEYSRLTTRENRTVYLDELNMQQTQPSV